MSSTESRAASRKILRVRVSVMFNGTKRLIGRTVDISANGLGATLEEAIPNGQTCLVAMDLLINGVPRHFEAEARVIHCVCSGTVGFRTGFQFVNLSAANAALINSLPSA